MRIIMIPFALTGSSHRHGSWRNCGTGIGGAGRAVVATTSRSNGTDDGGCRDTSDNLAAPEPSRRSDQIRALSRLYVALRDVDRSHSVTLGCSHEYLKIAFGKVVTEAASNGAAARIRGDAQTSSASEKRSAGAAFRKQERNPGPIYGLVVFVLDLDYRLPAGAEPDIIDYPVALNHYDLQCRSRLGIRQTFEDHEARQ